MFAHVNCVCSCICNCFSKWRATWKICFGPGAMRTHLLNCLEQANIIMFSVKKTRCNRMKIETTTNNNANAEWLGIMSTFACLYLVKHLRAPPYMVL